MLARACLSWVGAPVESAGGGRRAAALTTRPAHWETNTPQLNALTRILPGLLPLRAAAVTLAASSNESGTRHDPRGKCSGSGASVESEVVVGFASIPSSICSANLPPTTKPQSRHTFAHDCNYHRALQHTRTHGNTHGTRTEHLTSVSPLILCSHLDHYASSCVRDHGLLRRA
jgi:hypothetical protein